MAAPCRAEVVKPLDEVYCAWGALRHVAPSPHESLWTSATVLDSQPWALDLVNYPVGEGGGAYLVKTA